MIETSPRQPHQKEFLSQTKDQVLETQNKLLNTLKK